MIMALLLDLATIVGGFLLAVPVLRRLPRVGDELGWLAARLAPVGWVVGLVALVAGGYYLVVHLFSGPRVFHFEVVGIGVGLALLRDRLIAGRAWAGGAPSATTVDGASKTATVVGVSKTATAGGASRATAPQWPEGAGNPVPGQPSTVVGLTLLLAAFGLIAMIVGIQGLFTPDG